MLTITQPHPTRRYANNAPNLSRDELTTLAQHQIPVVNEQCTLVVFAVAGRTRLTIELAK